MFNLGFAIWFSFAPYTEGIAGEFGLSVAELGIVASLAGITFGNGIQHVAEWFDEENLETATAVSDDEKRPNRRVTARKFSSPIRSRFGCRNVTAKLPRHAFRTSNHL